MMRPNFVSRCTTLSRRPYFIRSLPLNRNNGHLRFAKRSLPFFNAKKRSETTSPLTSESAFHFPPKEYTELRF